MGKVYVVKKCHHYSRHLPKLCYRKTKLRATFKFTDGCWFPLSSPDDYAINKLVGFSRGRHHKNSVRCGWTPNKEPGLIDLFFYLYIKGVRQEMKFTTVEIGLEYTLEIDLSSNLVYFSLRKNGLPIVNNSLYFPTPRCFWGYILFPHIGGKLPARTDTKIELSIA